ncbi:MAG: iron-sulfur cluster assembly scaffold protein [Chloroflexi bacterium]|nr:iron-sulfur cluster assembly scaffold protein [Chloroflexota bacterium]
MYNEIVTDHFTHPRNVGVIENADAEGSVGNPVCGDYMTIYVKVDQGRIAEARFQTFGCSAAIAASSMMTEMVKGKTLDEAMTLTNMDIAKALGGLPQSKIHCSVLAADALHAAVREYRKRK